MRVRSPTSASPAFFCRDRSAFLTTPWSKWFSRCRKRSPVKRTALCSARDALLAPKTHRRRKTRRRRPRTQSSQPAFSITNFCIRVSQFRVRFGLAWPFLISRRHRKFFATTALQTLMTKRFPGIFFNRTQPLRASKLSITDHISRSDVMKARLFLYFIEVILLGVLAASVGCAKAPTDAQIATDIQNKLNADSGLQGKQLIVQADKGSVTLSGQVDTDAQRDAAARYASSEAGVKQVVNNLQVAPPPPIETQAPPPPAPAPAVKHRRKPKEDNSFKAPAEV